MLHVLLTKDDDFDIKMEAVTARHTGKNGENSKSVDCSMNEKTKLEKGEGERERVAVRATGK